MSKLLIDENPLLVLPSLASVTGLEEAIFLQQLHYWIQRAGVEQDGRRWVYNTYEQWAAQFTWWSVQAIRRIVASLRRQGLIETTTDYNRLPIDKTLWYCILYDRLDTLLNGDPPPPPPTVEINSPSVEIDTSTVEINSPSVEINSPRVEFDSPRVEFDTPITIRLLQETTAEEGGGGSTDLLSDLPDSEKNARARAHEAAAADPPAEPPTFDAANRNPAAIDAALAYAGIHAPLARSGIVEAQPGLTVADVLAWNAQRNQDNAGIPAARQMGHGALAALLRTGQRPPSGAYDFARVERWLQSAGFLPEPEPPPSIPSISSIPLPCAADAAVLWTALIGEIRLANHALADNWLRDTTAVSLIDDHLTVQAPTDRHVEWLTVRMTASITTRLTRLANRPITVQFEASP